MRPLWPIEPPGYVFLAVAFEKFGTERFGDEWTRRERMTFCAPRVLPELDLATSDDRHNGFLYLCSARPDRAAALVKPTTWFNTVLGRGLRERQFSDEDWAIATDASRRVFELDEPVFRRGAAIRQEMAALCCDGQLVTYARPVPGGAMTPISPEAWNTEHLFGRFANCKISPSNPFGALGDAGDVSWIFVTQASLEMVCAPATKTGAKGRPYFSPYIRCMLATSKKLHITRRKQPKKVEVELDLAAQFGKAKLDYGEHLLKAAATLLRDPESQLGRNK